MAKNRTRRRIPDRSSPVSTDHRFSAGNPCPICGGHPGVPRGQEARCWGFRTSDNAGVVCTRIESAHPAGDSEGWRHPLPEEPAKAEPGQAFEPHTGDDGATYIYEDEGGVPLFHVVRRSGKQFYQELPDGTKQVAGVRQVPFRLPEILLAVKAGKTIYIVEGEKDVISLERVGHVGTTNAGGAGKWRDEFAVHFKGARVIVVADKDERGESHARDVRRSLLRVTREVSIVEARSGNDASDHLDSGHPIEEFVPVLPRFDRVLLGNFESQPVTWLAEPVLIEGAYTLITSKPGKGKTALALSLSIPVINEGRLVVLLDQENGPDAIAARLRAMGADPATVDKFFAYFPFPSAAFDELDELVAEVSVLQPDLVVVDAKANFLASADLDEDLAADLTGWHSRFVQPLQEVGAAVLELDHSGHRESGRPRGSSAKEAVAEASWVLTSDRAFDLETTAQVTLQRGIKNRRGVLPERVDFQMGGDGEGGFVFRELASEAEKPSEDIKRKREFVRGKIISALRRHGPLSGNKIEEVVRGADLKLVREIYKDLPEVPGSKVTVKKGPRNAFVYSVNDDEEGGGQ